MTLITMISWMVIGAIFYSIYINVLGEKRYTRKEIEQKLKDHNIMLMREEKMMDLVKRANNL